MGRKKGSVSSHTAEQSKSSSSVSLDLKREIFQYWKDAMGKSRPILDAKREQRIGWAISNYGLEACRQAIDGCVLSDWHMGKNPSNKTYNDISLIFQDAKHVEMFLEYHDAGKKKSSRDAWINE